VLSPEPIVVTCPIFFDPAFAALGGFGIGVFVCGLIVMLLRLREAAAPLHFADDRPAGDVPHVPWGQRP
jgi:hypothetical protein